jgi:N utilization substance protein A
LFSEDQFDRQGQIMDINELRNLLKQIGKEKNVDVSVLKSSIEEAIVLASRKPPLNYEDARAELDVESGKLRVLVRKTVIPAFVKNPRTEIPLSLAVKVRPGVAVGEILEVEIDPADLGRIAAVAVRTMFTERVSRAERGNVFEEYQSKVGEVLSGTVIRKERNNDLVLSVGRTEALLPRTECPSNAHYTPNTRLKVYLQALEVEGRGPVLRVSRNDPGLVERLFEQEVPEIADGTVKIVGIAREPGVRTKIAVQSLNPDVDPVGTCVGVKGSRVQQIVQELSNEKVDIVPYSLKSEDFIKAALVPAQIASVVCDDTTGMATVIVREGDLARAIGTRGQNAKLASRLTRWKLDIHSEGEERKRSSLSDEEVALKYLEDFLVQVLPDHEEHRRGFFQGTYNSVEKIASAEPSDVANLVSGSSLDPESLVEQARYYVEALANYRQTEFGDSPVDAGLDDQDLPSPGDAESAS